MAYENHSTELGATYQTIGQEKDEHIYACTRVNIPGESSHTRVNIHGRSQVCPSKKRRGVLLFTAAALISVSVVLSAISLYRTETVSCLQQTQLTKIPENSSPLTSNITMTPTTSTINSQSTANSSITTSTRPPSTSTITTTSTRPPSTSTQLPSCSSGYLLNPFSNTCFGTGIRTSWTQAKRYCEDKGEFLATPHSLESASWLQQMHINKGLNSCTIYMYCISMHTHIQILGAQLYDFDPHWLISNIFVAHFHF